MSIDSIKHPRHFSANQCFRYAPIRCHFAHSLETESQVLFQSVAMRREEVGPGGRQQWFSPDPLHKSDLNFTVFMQNLLLLLQLPRSCPVPGRARERKPPSAFHTILTHPVVQGDFEVCYSLGFTILYLPGFVVNKLFKLHQPGCLSFSLRSPLMEE